MQITLTTRAIDGGGSCAIVRLDGKQIGEYWRIGEVIQYGMGDDDECYKTTHAAAAIVHILMKSGVIIDQTVEV